MTFRDKIVNYIQAGFPVLWVTTHEEERAETELKAAAKAEDLASVWIWSVTQGFQSTDGKAQDAKAPKAALQQIPSLQAESMYILRDFHPYLSAPDVVRTFRDILHPCKSSGRLIVILSPVLNIPTELEKDITVVDFALPTREELKGKLDSVLKAIGENRTDGEKKPPVIGDVAAVLDAASGQTQAEAENSFALAWSTTRREKPDAKARNAQFNESVARTVRGEKAGAIKKSGLVEWIESKFTMDDVGGLGNVKADLKVIAPIFHDPEGAKKFGFKDEDFPRSIAFVGVPGTGKSLAAEAIPMLLSTGCVRTDFGRIFSAGGGKVGAAENNIEQRNKLVEAMAPVVDWWDEAEKGLAGAKGDSTQNPWEARIGASLLTWFEAYRARVLVVATINRVDLLPPEMVNRFQRIYFVDLPDEDELVEIFNIHLNARGISIGEDKVRALAIKTHNYNGRECRNIVQAAMQAAFAAKDKSVTYEHLVAAAESITPLAVARPDDVRKMQQWAKDHKIRPASARKDPEAAASSGRRVR